MATHLGENSFDGTHGNQLILPEWGQGPLQRVMSGSATQTTQLESQVSILLVSIMFGRTFRTQPVCLVRWCHQLLLAACLHRAWGNDDGVKKAPSNDMPAPLVKVEQ